MFEIAIDELGIGSDKVAFVQLPANKNAVIDAMDREKIFGETFLRIAECDEVPELNGFEFSKEPTLDELNFLAKRIEEISADETHKAAYRAILQKPFETINKAVNRTFDLDSIPVFPCKNYAEYGKVVLENDFLEELEDVPDEFTICLTRKRSGVQWQSARAVFSLTDIMSLQAVTSLFWCMTRNFPNAWMTGSFGLKLRKIRKLMTRFQK